ncbi:MAG: oligosaccharide flippase family protein, partial [Candidatus Sericytochromatia bacterium]|nr:oligosaccharide flippase family protein [Candidatus Sericytochromatia bacterium]
RALGPEGRGLLAVVATIGVLGTQFGTLGLPTAHTYYVAQDRRLLPEVLADALAISLVVGGVGALAAWALCTLFPQVAPLQGRLLALALAMVPLGVAGSLLQNLAMGVQKVRLANGLEVGGKALTLAGIGLLLQNGRMAVEAVCIVQLVAQCLILAGWGVAFRPLLVRVPRPSWALLQRHLPYGLKAYGAAVFALLTLKLDLLVVRHLQGLEAAGYYSIAMMLVDVATLLPMTVAAVVFPRLSALPDAAAKWRLAKRITGLTALALLPVTGLLALAAEPLIRWLFGVAATPAAPLLLALLPGACVLGVASVLAQYLASVGFPAAMMRVWVGLLLASVSLNFWAIPHWGTIGAAWVYTGVAVGYALVIGWLVRRH